MSGRPEGSDNGGYDSVEPASADAWQEFTPWRPGQSTSHAERHVEAASDRESGGFKWSEDSPRKLETGDRVQNKRAVGGVLGSAVPAGTYGEVLSKRTGLTEKYVTVRFESGYTEEVRRGDVEYKGWY